MDNPISPSKQDQLIALLKKKVLEISERHKKIVGELERRLQEEMAKTTKLQAESEIQIKVLKTELEAESVRCSKLEAELTGRGGAKVDIQKMKESAYAEAQISSLTENLKTEIARNTTLDKNLKIEMAKNAELQKELDEKNTGLQTELEKGRKSIELKLQELQTQNQQLTLETNTQKKQIETLENQLREREKEIVDLKQKISDQEQKLKEDHKHLQSEIKKKQDEIESVLHRMAQLQADRDNLYVITRTYDLITLGDQIEQIKLKVADLDRSGQQNDLKSALEEVSSLIKITNHVDDKVKDLLANFHNTNSELEAKLKNQIVIRS
jgi:DNA repair exonuclease SbcCD ATPase subunit